MKYDQLEAYFAEAVADIRQRLADMNIPDFQIELEANGRTLSGTVKLQYIVSGLYGVNAVVANSIEKCVEEMIRRHGWNNRHAPKCLPGTEGKEEDDTTF